MYSNNFLVAQTLLQFVYELVGILIQMIFGNFSPLEAQELHHLVPIHTSISTRSRNRESCCHQGIPGPSLDNHLVDGELDAWKIGEQTLEPCSDGFHASALPSERRPQTCLPLSVAQVRLLLQVSLLSSEQIEDFKVQSTETKRQQASG